MVNSFHQYQQNKQPPITSNNWTQKKKQYIWYWTFRSWLQTGTTMCLG